MQSRSFLSQTYVLVMNPGFSFHAGPPVFSIANIRILQPVCKQQPSAISFVIYWWSASSFPDAELPEYLAEDFVGGDFAGDGAEVGEGVAEVFSKEGAVEAGGEA